MSSGGGARWAIALLTAMQAERHDDLRRLLSETTVDGAVALAGIALTGVRTAAELFGTSTEEMLQDGGLEFADWEGEWR